MEPRSSGDHESAGPNPDNNLILSLLQFEQAYYDFCEKHGNVPILEKIPDGLAQEQIHQQVNRTIHAILVAKHFGIHFLPSVLITLAATVKDLQRVDSLQMALAKALKGSE